ncbi:MAG: alpha/beta hydrolase [Marinobacter sp.]|uniref:alpha/beta fold hydrolase n=1 Tax=Marinobacter sp. TaxID=50741 RepID=UPI0034A02133
MTQTSVFDASQASVAICHEMRWTLPHMSLSGLHWPSKAPSPQHPPVIMLHGWLDNSLSFTHLAPGLQDFTDVYAVDMAGHGLSDHRPSGQSYLLVDYVADLAMLVENEFDAPIDLVAHSLGGIVAMMYAAAHSEKVRKLVLIDSLGPITRGADDVVGQLQKSITKRIAGSGRSAHYTTIAEAAKAREGGLSPLSHEAAMTLVPRNLKPMRDGFEWRTDPKLRHPSPMLFAEPQAIAFLEAVTTDTLLVLADKGLLAERKFWCSRLEAVPSFNRVVVPGTHHCHLDGDTAPVKEAVRRFLFHEL